MHKICIIITDQWSFLILSRVPNECINFTMILCHSSGEEGGSKVKMTRTFLNNWGKKLWNVGFYTKLVFYLASKINERDTWIFQQIFSMI